MRGSGQFFLGMTMCQTRLRSEACQCLDLISVNVEDGVELCDLQEVADSFVEVHELQFPALGLHEPVSAHQFPESCAIDIVYSGQVEQEHLMPAVDFFANEVAQQRVS